jgi:hypothetical protein
MSAERQRRLILHMSVSLDGFVTGADGKLDWLAPEDAVDHGDQRPRTTVTSDFATPSRLAISLRSASLARPSSGGAVTRTSSRPSRSPATSSQRARGVRRTRIWALTGWFPPW